MKNTEARIRTYPLSLLNTVLLFLVLTFAVVFATVYFFLDREARSLLNVMSDRVISSKGETIGHTIRYYIDLPRQTNAVVTHALQDNAAIALPQIRAELQNVMDNVFTGNDYLSSVAFGSAAGDYVGIARRAEQPEQAYLTEKSPDTGQVLTFFRGVSVSSGVDDTLPGYDMFSRPWYSQVSQTLRPSWTQAYRDTNSDSGVSISYSTPLYGPGGRLTGVVSSDLRLTALNQLLSSLRPFAGSTLIMVNETNRIIAASDSDLTRGLSRQRLTDQRGLDLPALWQSSRPEVAAAGERLKRQDFTGIRQLQVKGQTWYILVTPLIDRTHQLNWKSIIIVPGHVMMKDLDKYRHLALFSLAGVFALGLLFILVVVFRVISPLQRIVSKTDALALARGNWSLPSARWSFPEIARLENAFWQLSRRLSASFQALEKQLNIDPVTGLLTRAGLLKALSPQKPGQVLAAIGVNNISTLSNTLGSEYGNAVLLDFVQRMQQVLPPGTLLCRDALDTFIVCFFHEPAEGDAETCRRMVAHLFMDTDELPSLRPAYEPVFNGHAGLVTGPVVPDTLTAVIMEASVALQHARKTRRCTALFTDSMHEQEIYNLRLHDALRRGIDRDEFYLVMQPIVRLEGGACREGECLVRWESETLGCVPPDAFIPLAEETGLILPLGRQIIEKACEELAHLIRRGAPADFKLHVNISAHQLRYASFATDLLDTIHRYGLQSQNIGIEMTETVLLNDISRTRGTLEYLRRQGVSVSIDDFGSGFSSLSYLSTLPFDVIKLDRQFISRLLTDPRCESVVAAVISLAQGLPVPLIAEGIEDEAMCRKLAAMGCDRAQGYFFKKPAPFADYHCGEGRFWYD